ncbi:MAG: hypothetical protein ACXWRE_13890 [Pseudobdellovibrionaceae bacterium]
MSKYNLKLALASALVSLFVTMQASASGTIKCGAWNDNRFPISSATVNLVENQSLDQDYFTNTSFASVTIKEKSGASVTLPCSVAKMNANSDNYAYCPQPTWDAWAGTTYYPNPELYSAVIELDTHRSGHLNKSWYIKLLVNKDHESDIALECEP